MRRSLPLGLSVALLLGTLACTTEFLEADECLGSPVTLSPAQVTVRVGDTVLVTAALTGPPQCLPPGLTGSNLLRWRVSDVAIAHIDPVKGILVATAAGSVHVNSYFPADSSTWGLVLVSVTGSP